jgi:hypothetical protein
MVLFLISLTFLLVVELIMSLSWRMVLDAPLMHYIAFLINQHGFVIYRDIFDFNLPGTYLFHLAVVKLFGYGDLAFRLVDVGWLCAILSLTYGFMKKFSKPIAWFAVVLLGLSYLQKGPTMSLQREIIGMLPVCLALFLAINRTLNSAFRYFIIGILFGLAAIIKPHLAIGLPLIIFFEWKSAVTFDSHKEKIKPPCITALSIISISFLGFVIPIFGSIIWLWQQGVLLYICETYFSYLPLYLSLNGLHQTVFGQERVIYLFTEYRNFGGYALWLIPAFLGVFIFLSNKERLACNKRIVYLLLGLTILYSIYPVFSGQFWQYHWIPFRYFIILLASLSLAWLSNQKKIPYQNLLFAIIFGFIFCFTLMPPNDFFMQLQGQKPVAPKDGRVDEIAYYLKAHLKPHDKVQPLDWTGGAVHAMLISKAELATPFLYDFYFYHHVSQPYIQMLRQRFMQKLKRNKPRYFVEMLIDKPWVSGVDTTQEFSELRDLLDKDYLTPVVTPGYIIYERRN